MSEPSMIQPNTWKSDSQIMAPDPMKRPLIVLTGPTAVGKTGLSLRLAKALGGQVISADSMQVYRHMDIGTAKIMPEEMQGIPHYLIDVLEPEEDFNVVRFQNMAKEALNRIYQAGDIPIVVGGTGFYIQALLYDTSFETETEETSYRQELQAVAQEKGAQYLHQQLEKVDPISAQSIHPNNVKRVIRALEYYKQTGSCISAHNEQQRKKESPYHFLYFVLNDNRQKLYERIDKRIDVMIEQGLIEEVQQLKASGCTQDMVSMQGLGYKEILRYLSGDCSLDDAIYILKRDTRHFAKRQITWFKRERDVIWINRQEFKNEEDILTYMLNLIAERFKNERGDKQ